MNATKTRMVIAYSKIHLLGSFFNIKIASDSLYSLIMGFPACQVYSMIRVVIGESSDFDKFMSFSADEYLKYGLIICI